MGLTTTQNQKKMATFFIQRAATFVRRSAVVAIHCPLGNPVVSRRELGEDEPDS